MGGTVSAVRFVPFTETEFEQYREETIPAYAAEHVRAGSYPADGALDRARAEFTSLVPQGIQTPGHTVVWIVAASTAQRVGHLWYFLPLGGTQMFIYDILVRPEFRRRGLAEAALGELDGIGREKGAKALGLHVFGDNTAAIALYEKLGFATTNRRMSKPL